MPCPRAAGLNTTVVVSSGFAYTRVYETAGKDSSVATEKARQQLGWEPPRSNQVALLRNFEWDISHRDRFAGQTSSGHRAPTKHGTLEILKRFFERVYCLRCDRGIFFSDHDESGSTCGTEFHHRRSADDTAHGNGQRLSTQQRWDVREPNVRRALDAPFPTPGIAD